MTAEAWFIDPQNLSGTANDANDGRGASTALRTGKRLLDLMMGASRRRTVPRGTLVDITFLSDMADTDRMSFEVTIDDPATSAFRMHGALTALLQTTVGTFTAAAPASNGRPTLAATGLTSAHVKKLVYFPAGGAWAIATECPSSGTLRITAPRVYSGSDYRVITLYTPAPGETVLIYKESKAYFGSLGFIAAWNATSAPGPWPSPFLLENFDCSDLVAFDGVGGAYQAAQIRQCSFADVIASASSSNLFRACAFTANAGATSNFGGTTQKPVLFSGCALFGGDVEMSGARFGVGANDHNTVRSSQVRVDRACTIQGALELSTQGAGEASGLWVNGVLTFASDADVVYGVATGNNALVLEEQSLLRYPAGVHVYTQTDARQLLVGGLNASTSLTPTLTSGSAAACDTWAKLLASPFNGSAYNASKLAFVRQNDAASSGATLAFYADVGGSITTGSTLADGQVVTAWGAATTTTGTPKLVTDSVRGGSAMRFGPSDRLRTAAGAAAFLSQGPSTGTIIWRSRKYNPGGSYTILDTTEGGTVAGFQLTVYDNDNDIFSQRLFAIRIFDGATWILDKPLDEQWGHFIPEKWHVITFRVSATRWDIRVDGKDLHFTTQTINITLPSSATGRLAIGGGYQDIKAIEAWNLFRADVDVVSDEIRLAARFPTDMIIPVLGLINVANPLNPQYTAFPWATFLPNGDLDVCCFNGDTESPAPNTFVTEQKSTDGGLTWPAPTTIFSSAAPVSEAGAWTLVMSNGHVLRVGYTWDIPSGLGKVLWAQVSTDGGNTYGPTGTPQPSNPSRTDITIGGPFYVQAGGAPVEDPDNPGHIHWGIYRAQTTIAGGWDAVDYQSANFGATWSQVTIADGTADGHQYAEPQLLFHSSGEVRCLIRDYSGHGSPGAGLMVMTRSLNKGVTWSAVSAQVIDANSAGQSYCQTASGRELWLGRPNTYLTLALYSRPAGAAWDVPWDPVARVLYIDPRGKETEMVYGTIIPRPNQRTIRVWGTFTGNNPNTVADTSLQYDDEWIVEHAMPGVITPSAPTLNVNATQQFAATGAGDFTWALSVNNSGGSINASSGLYTAGTANGVDTVTVTDLNTHVPATATITVTGAGSNAPTVTSITPDYGFDTGGTSVTIHGTNFTGATAVSIGGTALSSFTVVNATTITGTTAGHLPAANATVSVTTSQGTGTANLFSYIPSGMTVFLIGDVMTTAGADINVWPDQSGNGNDATPPSFPPQVGSISAHPSAHFLGGGDVFTFATFTAGLTAMDLFVIGKHTADDNTNQTPFEFTDDGGPPRIPLGTDRKIYDNTGSTTQQATNFAPAAGKWAQPWLYNVIATSAEWTARFNGTQIFTQASNTFGYGRKKLGAGLGGTYVGDLAVVLMYPSKLSSGDRTVVETWLKTKYSVV